MQAPTSVRGKGASQYAGFLVVSLTMVEMFTIPRSYFILGSIVSTSAMVCVALLVSDPFKTKSKPRIRNLAIAVVLAIVLYLIFYAGNYAIKNHSLPGIQTNNEQSIYDLFTNTPVILLVFVFALDAVGFETYFRANLQRLFYPRIGVGSVFLVAGIDALIHVSALNPLFPATVIVTDSIWGLNYYFTDDVYSNILTHFLWDLLIFVIFPIH